ncbi:MAG: pilin [Marinomonas sp.]|uniref:pilin n=1 Tax=Marinomonas sp. 2405UD66-6 TaxID=3391834 RepID=UPI00329E3CEE
MQISRPYLRGFTLLELMVVIAIISILASLSAPTFTRQIAKAKLIEAQNLATQHQSLVEEFILLNGDFPTSSEFDLIKSTLSESSIVKSIIVENQSDDTGDIKLTFNTSTAITEGEFLTYSRDSNRNWSCSSDLDDNILPNQCVSASTGEEE